MVAYHAFAGERSLRESIIPLIDHTTESIFAVPSVGSHDLFPNVSTVEPANRLRHFVWMYERL